MCAAWSRPNRWSGCSGCLSTLGPDEQLLIIIDRQPRPLYRILQNNGYAYRETFKSEGIFEILIWPAR
jgi:uncharacterized protein (DUF2249 family)